MLSPSSYSICLLTLLLLISFHSFTPISSATTPNILIFAFQHQVFHCFINPFSHIIHNLHPPFFHLFTRLFTSNDFIQALKSKCLPKLPLLKISYLGWSFPLYYSSAELLFILQSHSSFPQADILPFCTLSCLITYLTKIPVLPITFPLNYIESFINFPYIFHSNIFLAHIFSSIFCISALPLLSSL